MKHKIMANIHNDLQGLIVIKMKYILYVIIIAKRKEKNNAAMDQNCS